jgi:adenylylsulfate kinase
MGPNNLGERGGNADGGLTVWLTGLSGSGKTTICDAVYLVLISLGYKVEILDGDAMRKQLTRDLGFTSRVLKKSLSHAV